MTSQHQNEQQESTKKRILVVDDEPDITFTLKEGLEKSGLFDVETFTDPSSALSNFKSGYYDFLLIDIRMPKIDGYELYDKIRAIDAKVKACFISAYNVNYKALREQFPTIKMECYAKPLEIDELIRKITDELDQN
ncbi:MAG: response regulator [Nitrososphaeraceae archaeon]|jgi:CheY-like chemotaxis protein